ncbi:MAG: hypothetical protein WDW36_002421 [Sanguina aurantia]
MSVAASSPERERGASADGCQLETVAPPKPRPVVLLWHGLLDACTGFLMNGPGKSLAFILADAGYDVWLGNSRGNTFSRAHTTLTPWDPAYWTFSWDEIATRDIPAGVQLAMRVAGVDHISYVGHSQGSTTLLAALAADEDGWLASAVKFAVLLAPAVFTTHIQSIPMVTLAALGTDGIFALLGIHEFFPSASFVSFLEGVLCIEEPSLCVNIIAAICGFNPDNTDLDKLPLYLSFTPAGTSVQNMAKWAQSVRAPLPNLLLRFDYGTACTSRTGANVTCNQRQYGQLRPPQYDLSLVKTPIALFTGGQDKLVTPPDLEYLLEALPAGVLVAHHKTPTFQHLDYVWGKNAAEMVYDKVVALLQEHDPTGPYQEMHLES